MTDQDMTQRGEEATRLLANELLTAVLEELDTRYVEAWKQAKTFEAREDAHRYVQLVKQFSDDIKTIIKAGQMAAHRLKELEGKPSYKIWR
jgi:hypothetical protein